MVTRAAESAETMRIARKRIDALKIPRLDGMSVMRVDKINDTAAVTMTVARGTPGTGRTQQTDRNGPRNEKATSFGAWWRRDV